MNKRGEPTRLPPTQPGAPGTCPNGAFLLALSAGGDHNSPCPPRYVASATLRVRKTPLECPHPSPTKQLDSLLSVDLSTESLGSRCCISTKSYPGFSADAMHSLSINDAGLTTPSDEFIIRNNVRHFTRSARGIMRTMHKTGLSTRCCITAAFPPLNQRRRFLRPGRNYHRLTAKAPSSLALYFCQARRFCLHCSTSTFGNTFALPRLTRQHLRGKCHGLIRRRQPAGGARGLPSLSCGCISVLRTREAPFCASYSSVQIVHFALAYLITPLNCTIWEEGGTWTHSPSSRQGQSKAGDAHHVHAEPRITRPAPPGRGPERLRTHNHRIFLECGYLVRRRPRRVRRGGSRIWHLAAVRALLGSGVAPVRLQAGSMVIS